MERAGRVTERSALRAGEAFVCLACLLRVFAANRQLGMAANQVRPFGSELVPGLGHFEELFALAFRDQSSDIPSSKPEDAAAP